MNTTSFHLAIQRGKRLFGLLALCALTLSMAACMSSSQSDKGGSAGPNTKKMAYGLSVNAPSSWNIVSSISPEAATKETLDSRRQSGERILMLEMKAAATPKGLEPRIGVFLVSEKGTFMPREYAEKLTPEEFSTMSKDLLTREHAMAKKKKEKSGVLDIQIARDSIAGQFTVLHRILVAMPNGEQVRLMNWDIYLPNGAGIAIKSVCDPDVPNLESDMASIAKSLMVVQ